MLNTKFTQETNTNTKEESKMKNLKEEMLNIYNLVNESRISKEKKAEITNSLTAIKDDFGDNKYVVVYLQFLEKPYRIYKNKIHHT